MQYDLSQVRNVVNAALILIEHFADRSKAAGTDPEALAKLNAELVAQSKALQSVKKFLTEEAIQPTRYKA